MMGGCEGAHVFDGITRDTLDFIFQKLKDAKADITGDTDGPWDIDTHNSGVKIRGEWNRETSQISITVTAKNRLLPCALVWQRIDHLMNQV